MESPDLLEFYDEHFQPGAIDLSASCPPPMPIDGFEHRTLRTEDLAFVPPSGGTELRAAIARRYHSIGPDDVRLAAGASEALAALAFATLKPGHRAWAAPGSYPSFLEAAAKVGAAVADGESVPPGATLAVGCNPTVREGAVVEVEAFLEECGRAGALPVMDEVYRDLHIGGPLPAIADADPRAVSIGDLSKPLGLGGIRIGWLATRNEELREQIDRELQLLSGGPSSLSVAAAVSAFDSFDEAVQATMVTATRNLPGIRAALERHGWQVVESEAGVTMLGIPPQPVSPADLNRLEEAGFFLLPGEAIGVPNAFRVTLLREAKTWERALEVLHGRSA